MSETGNGFFQTRGVAIRVFVNWIWQYTLPAPWKPPPEPVKAAPDCHSRRSKE